MVKLLDGFDANFHERSVQATVYSFWQYFFLDSLFKQYTIHGEHEMTRVGVDMVNGKEVRTPLWSNDKIRFSFTDNYLNTFFVQKLILKLSDGEVPEKYNKLCKKAYFDGYNGDEQCQHNLARAFFDAYIHLEKLLGSDTKNWEYRNVHVNEYVSMPWSLTPLKPLFHRETPTGGNGQTPGVSKYKLGSIKENRILKSTHVAGYKQVNMFDKDPSKDVNLYSIDTGMGGHPFSGNYFNLNKGHLAGDLLPLSHDFQKLL